MAIESVATESPELPDYALTKGDILEIESITTESPHIPDYVLSGTERDAASQKIDRAIAALEVIEAAGRHEDGFCDAVSTTVGAVNEWLAEVLQALDHASVAQGA
ncbi:MAG TPA: hypothetical protein VJ833_10230 [Rhodanobacteraceae bacterium]|nr:hypothetical protein [Rhodanobacteraceae bacterium]